MPRKRQSFADILERAYLASEEDIVLGSSLRRREREALTEKGYLTEIIRGYYVLGAPQPGVDPRTIVNSSFWNFLNVYLRERFGSAYCLSAEGSLDLHTGVTSTPKQAIVIAGSGGSQTVDLPNGSSVLMYPDPKALPESTVKIQGVNVIPLPDALTRVGPSFFTKGPRSATIAILSVAPIELAQRILASSNFTAGNRLLGAAKHVGRTALIESLEGAFASVGRKPTPTNPFDPEYEAVSPVSIASPHAARLEIMWDSMRSEVIANFPAPPAKKKSLTDCLQGIADVYEHDALNSLSIEGYKVTPDLIRKIRDGDWDPYTTTSDKEHVGAMAAFGYHKAFNAVVETITRSYEDPQSCGSNIEKDLPSWFLSLNQGLINAGVLNSSDVSGWRSHPVYIRTSRHVPPPRDSLSSCMGSFFGKLKSEPHPAVRAVLGHALFVFTHPFMDGNGRIGRFIMNSALVTGGYPWTIINNAESGAYFSALESFSVRGRIAPFAEFLAKQMAVEWSPPKSGARAPIKEWTALKDVPMAKALPDSAPSPTKSAASGLSIE